MNEPISPDARAIWLEPLPSEEFDRRLKAALEEVDGPELENLVSLIRWFQRRYPLPKSLRGGIGCVRSRARLGRRFCSSVKLCVR